MTSPAPKADRFPNRAPKGGAVSPVNGLFYAGGQFMPMAVAGLTTGPVRLEGSTRQVAWATRLRDVRLARLDAVLAHANALLSVAPREEAPAIRAARRTVAIARHNLKCERSAAAIIDRRNATA